MHGWQDLRNRSCQRPPLTRSRANPARNRIAQIPPLVNRQKNHELTFSGLSSGWKNRCGAGDFGFTAELPDTRKNIFSPSERAEKANPAPPRVPPEGDGGREVAGGRGQRAAQQQRAWARGPRTTPLAGLLPKALPCQRVARLHRQGPGTALDGPRPEHGPALLSGPAQGQRHGKGRAGAGMAAGYSSFLPFRTVPDPRHKRPTVRPRGSSRPPWAVTSQQHQWALWGSRAHRRGGPAGPRAHHGPANLNTGLWSQSPHHRGGASQPQAADQSPDTTPCGPVLQGPHGPGTDNFDSSRARPG